MTEFSWQPKGNGIFKEGMISLSKTSYIPKQITNITHTAPDPHPTDPEIRQGVFGCEASQL